MEQDKKLIVRHFSSAFALARFVNLNKIEQHQIVQITDSRDTYTLFFLSESPLEFDKLTELFDRAFIEDLNYKKRCNVMANNRQGCYIIPTSLKEYGQDLSCEEWIELLCKFNDTEDYITFR